jgi:hypothetical protein
LAYQRVLNKINEGKKMATGIVILGNRLYLAYFYVKYSIRTTHFNDNICERRLVDVSIETRETMAISIAVYDF